MHAVPISRVKEQILATESLTKNDNKNIINVTEEYTIVAVIWITDMSGQKQEHE
jgi:hypothetical protein